LFFLMSVSFFLEIAQWNLLKMIFYY